jgi:alpha-N-arabinofuranosidase
VPARWEDDWLIVSPGTGRVEFDYPVPSLPEHIFEEPPLRDDFDNTTLAYHWNFLRTPHEDFYSLTERPGFFRLHLRPQKLSEQSNPSFVGRRQQHINFTAQTEYEFTPHSNNECAGLALIQNKDFYYLFVVTRDTDIVVRLIKRTHGIEETLVTQPVSASRFVLKISACGQNYNFYFSTNNQWRPLAENIDGRILSTPVAGGFVGTYIGMYASSNGQPGANHADFDWFEYSNQDPSDF